MHPFGDHLGSPVEREAVGENDELVAAESPDGVARAQNAEQPSRHQLQQLVARPVSQGVVGVLEIVQIDEQGRHGGTRTSGPHQHLLRPVQDQLTVRQSRQRIVQCAMGQEGLELLALGDVTDVGDIPGHRGAVRLVRDHGFDVAARPVSAHHAELERCRPAARLELSSEERLHGVEVIGVHEVGREEADELLRLVLDEFFDRGRHVAVHTRVSEDHRDVGSVLDQRAEPVLAQAEMGLGLLLLFHRLLVLLHDGAGHPDDDVEDEAPHHGQRGGRRPAQLGREPPLGEADLCDDHGDDAPQDRRPPQAGSRPRHVLQRDEDVRRPQDGAPSRQVDGHRDRGHLADHSEVEREFARVRVVDAIHYRIDERNGGEDDEPLPPRHPFDVAEPHQDQHDGERRRPDQIGQLGRIQPPPRRRRSGIRRLWPVGAGGLTRTVLRSQSHVPRFDRSAQPPSIVRLGGRLDQSWGPREPAPNRSNRAATWANPQRSGSRAPGRRPAGCAWRGIGRRHLPDRLNAQTASAATLPDLGPIGADQAVVAGLPPAAGSPVHPARPRHDAPTPVRGGSDGP